MLLFFNATTPAWNITCGIAAKKSARNPPDFIILDNWVFQNLILAGEPFTKVLRSLENYILVNNNLFGKLASSLESPSTFDERFKVTLVLSLFLILTY